MPLKSLLLTESKLGVCTDLYELTMAAAYYSSGRFEELATFELFTRELPPRRSFLVAAGLEQAIHHVLEISFSEEVIGFLQQLEVFQRSDPGFWDYLMDFQFSGEIWALPEGTVFFENEPIIQVKAPVIEAQILETLLINCINVQTLVASKAARICQAAGDKMIVDFGSRRAHGPQTSVLAARAAYIGGCAGTSNVLAGFELGIPVYGTMAHSYIQFFDSEPEAFVQFQETFPDHSVLLIDTYDIFKGLEHALQLEEAFRGVRVDSGNFSELTPLIREKLDAAGRPDALIMVSGNLTEDRLLAFEVEDLPIDAYGVGTDLVVSGDVPTCDLIYKLVETEKEGVRVPKLKKSSRKETIPFRKKLVRRTDGKYYSRDLLLDWEDEPPGEEYMPLLQHIVHRGELVRELPGIEESRSLLRHQMERLPKQFRYLHSSEKYPVWVAGRLADSVKPSNT